MNIEEKLNIYVANVYLKIMCWQKNKKLLHLVLAKFKTIMLFLCFYYVTTIICKILLFADSNLIFRDHVFIVE